MNDGIAVIINNNVQREVVSALTKRGVTCIGIQVTDEKHAQEILIKSKKLLLPFPSTKMNIKFLPEGGALRDYLTPEHTVIGGMIKEDLKAELEKSGVKYRDYFENEAYVLKNAQLTSQGAVRLLLENTNDSLVGKRVLITGFGRIGKSLALMLKSLGMKVYVAVRREEAAVDALAMGFEVFNSKTVNATVFYYDYIFNTVPSVLFTYKDISHLNNSAVYFELASSPFGADRKNFELLGKNYIHGGALPGRYFPVAVAKNIVDYILSTKGDWYE